MHHDSISPALIAGLGLAVGLAAGCSSGKSTNRRNKREAQRRHVLEVTSLPTARAEATATLLRNGEVLVAGGLDGAGQPLHTTVLIAPDGRTRSGPDLINPRAGHTATLLSDGRILIAGGYRDTTGLQGLRSTELFVAEANRFELGPVLSEVRSGHAALAVSTAGPERVLLAGGWTRTMSGTVYSDRIELLDVLSGSSQILTDTLPEPQAYLQAALLDSGQVVFAGGTGSAGPAAPARLDTFTNAVTPFPARRERIEAAVASVGSCALIVGGTTSEGIVADVEVVSPGAGAALQAERMLSTPRTGATAVPVGDAVVVAGGATTGGALSERVEVIRDCGATVAPWYPLQVPRRGHAAVAIGRRILLIGGYDARGIPLRSVEVIDLDQPTPISQLSPEARSRPAPAPPPAQPGSSGPAAPTTSGTVVLGS